MTSHVRKAIWMSIVPWLLGGCLTPPVETECDDGIDNDGDLIRDCGDSDCFLHSPACDLDGGSGGSSGGSPSVGASGSGGGTGSTCFAPALAQATSTYAAVGNLATFTDFTASSCQADGGGADIALYYTAPTAGSLTVSVYATYADVDVSLRSNCNDPTSELPYACTAAASSGADDSFSVYVAAGQTVFIIVSGASATDTDTALLSLALD